MLNLKTLFVVLYVVFTSASYAFSTKAKHALLIDADTNEILFQKNASSQMHPSSMSKLMSVYVAFDMLRQKQINLTDTVKVSTKAWKTGGSKMFLSPTSDVSIEELLRGIIVQSGNDACIALAENIGGTEQDFVTRMNSLAHEIGLKNSNFANSTGLPDKSHYMTAFDLAALAKKIVYTFPEYYRYFAETDFTYNNITQPNRNTLLKRSVYVDGLKTGHTSVGGYGLVASASKNGRRFVLVVNGLKNEKEREEEASNLLQYGMLNFTNVTIAKTGETIATTDVYLGSKTKLPLMLQDDLVITTHVTQQNKVKAKLVYDSGLQAPINKGTKVGILEVHLPNTQLKYYNVYAAEDVEKVNPIKALWSKATRFLKKGNAEETKLSTISKESTLSGDKLVFF